jgi:hypothetical protein
MEMVTSPMLIWRSLDKSRQKNAFGFVESLRNLAQGKTILSQSLKGCALRRMA